MRYHEACRLFKTKHWGTLWQNNILDPDGLKEKSQHTFVAIDFEGLIAKDERIGITEIGIAVLSPLFDLAFEFKTIASHLSQITQYFSSWVDLQEITAEVSNENSPGMKDTLLAFGFFRPDLAVRGKSDHNAGNDAIRQLAVPVNLLNLRKGGRLHFDRHGDRVEDRDALQKFWNQTRPCPKELYPFTARIRIEGKDLISLVPNCPRLFSLFSDYQPTAVGMTRFGKYGWVCLPSLEELNRLITEIHGQEFKGEIWNAFTDYDPEVLHLTRQQLREVKRAGQEAQREPKQLFAFFGINQI
ncbi:hypothetical protein SCUP515_13223 [Seiridium cupressi]